MRWPASRLVLGPLLAFGYYLFLTYLTIFRRRRRPAAWREADRVLQALYSWRAWSPLEPFWATNRALNVLHARSAPMDAPCLELGAQYGYVSSLIFEGRRIALGSDIDPRWIDCLKQAGQYERVALMDALSLPFEDGQLGSIALFNAIYHMHRERTLAELHRVLAPGGTLVLTDAPNYARIHPVYRVLRELGLYGAAARYRRWAMKSFSIDRLVPAEAWRRIDGFEAVAIVPYASMELSIMSRIGFAFFYEFAPLGVPERIAKPWLRRRFLQSIVRAAHQAYWLPTVAADADFREHCMAMVVLQKPGTRGDTSARWVCPVCRGELDASAQELRCGAGHRYPVRDGCPVLIPSWERIEALR